MRKGWSIGAGVLLVVLGAVWTTQGLGYLAGSFMTGQQLWTAIGLVCAVCGVALLVSGLRRK
ncbi:hypothetical protein ABZ816_34805 [Actinosynnema sp. NPDC047251]|uniref:Uncharacterized protein n=1 Tax=Saccharothrix espanaensis (strain ATCC 51144 / DSM 44229 / JCM 9112 / NBRC 15066 / NRRL 15764) TaxID=1179773 RepID=K0JS39_SACES|nr:hypothetical protein [Saccharothrix espanaensis]CCH28626.1 hypothetical protein BN6_13000 [Saccharothrix espanaensis DSM 44229]